MYANQHLICNRPNKVLIAVAAIDRNALKFCKWNRAKYMRTIEFICSNKHSGLVGATLRFLFRGIHFFLKVLERCEIQGLV